MKVNYKKCDIDHKYYCVIKKYLNHLIDDKIYLDFNNNVVVKLTVSCDEYENVIIIIVVESDNLDILYKELNNLDYTREDILVNRKFLNE